MTWKLCPPTVLVYIIVLCVVIVFCGPGPAQGYEDPGMSGRDLRIYNNGTLSFSVVYQNWTGYWTTQTTVAAGVLLLDEAGEIWYSGSDVVIQVAPRNESSVDRRMLSLSDPAMYQNVYESVSSLSGDCGASSACCSDDNSNSFQYDLNFNATEYIAYTVTAPSSQPNSNEFEVSISVAATDDSSGEELEQASMSIQPWQSFPATAVASSQQIANLTGSVTLTQIQTEAFDILYAVPEHDVAYSLLQTSLDDEGTLVDPYQFGDSPNWFGLQIDNWQGNRAEDCVNPLGYYTWYLGPVFEETPYFTEWNEGPTPFPETATVNDSYNQLAWYENNLWAAYAGKLQLTTDARFQRNTIAANIPANGQVNCSMLYNVPSASPELVTNGSSDPFMAIVNIAQAVICEYPSNVMMVTATIPAEAFNFAKAVLGLVSNGSQAYWYPGTTSGSLLLTLENTGNVAQVIDIVPGACCLTSPTPTCDSNIVMFSAFAQGGVAVLQSGEISEFDLYIQTSDFGAGYCNVSVAYMSNTSLGTVASLPFDTNIGSSQSNVLVEQIYFSAVVGPPISFTVYFDLFWPSVNRLTYMSASDTSLNSNDEPGYTDFSNGAGLALQSSADLLAPGAQVSLGPLPPGAAAAYSTGRRRHLSSSIDPFGLSALVWWPPAYSNATAILFGSQLVNNMSLVMASFSSYGVPFSPLQSQVITTTYAPPPPVSAPPPPSPPPSPPIALPPVGLAPLMAPSSPTLTPTSTASVAQGLSCSGQVVVCGAHGQLDSNCECNCEEGWTTEPFQASSDVQYCNLSTSEGVQGRTSLLFGGSNKIGPLGIVVIVVVVICLATSAWLCFMMHMRVKRKYSNNLHRKFDQRPSKMFEHDTSVSMIETSSKLAQIEPQLSKSALLAEAELSNRHDFAWEQSDEEGLVVDHTNQSMQYQVNRTGDTFARRHAAANAPTSVGSAYQSLLHIQQDPDA